MHRGFTDQARQAMAIAEQESRGLHHAYIGTEHILLGLVQDDKGIAARLLQTLKIDADGIRQEVEKLVQRGPELVRALKLPLTPRAKQAIEFADEDASFLQLDRIGPEHLFFGLLREQDGVAGQVLLGLGLDLHATAKLLFRDRMLQLKLVERIVRPVRAGTVRKRKMREELLAHLTAIYDDELAQGSDPATAMHQAANRFGDPNELTRELQSAQPLSERIRYQFERWIGWRAPESGTRWMARLAMQVALLLVGVNVLAAVWMVTALGWTASAWIVMRAIMAMSLLLPILEFVLGALYFKVRDATFGVFGSRKSRLRSASLAMLMGLAVFLTGVSFVALGNGDVARASDFIQLGVAGLFTTIFVLTIARQNGPIEIRDAIWACLDIGNPPPDDETALEPA